MPLTCLDTDLDVLFASSDFGEADGAILNGDTANPIPGIFDDGDVEAQGEGDLTVIVNQTTFTCRSSKIPDPNQGDTLTINGTDYTLQYWNDDGTGVIELFLEAP